VQVPTPQAQCKLTGNIKTLRAQFHHHKIFHRLVNYLYTCSYICVGKATISLMYVKNYWQGWILLCFS